MEHRDAVVAGGGLVGATAALAFARGGLSVVVIDPGAPDDPRWSAVSHAALRAWEALGVRGLREAAQPIAAMAVGDAPRPSASSAPWALTAALGFAAADGERGDEPLGWMVENRAVRAAVADALRDAGVTARAALALGAEADARDVRVRLAGGGEIAAPLAVGAEGRTSALRDAAGIETETHAYGRCAVSATVRLAQPHGGVARQLFLPDGPLAVLPLPDDRANLVWTTEPAIAEALAAMAVAAFEAHLARRLGDGLGPATLEGGRAVFPLERRLAERLTGPRTALAGDAAHAIHPVAGQGLNLGLKDAAALAEVVVEARRLGEDWGSPPVLDRYARWRRFDRAALAAGAGLFAAGFSTAAAPARALRGAALLAAALSGPLRRTLAREAGGTLGEPPRLFRGEAL